MSEQTGPTKQRRKQYWIAKGFQNRVIGRFVVIVIGSIALSQCMTIAYFKLREMLDPASGEMLYLANTLQETLASAKLVEVLWFPLLLSTLLGSLLVLIVGLFYSHRIAGPLFNLKRRLGDAAAGDLSLPMKIRRSDEFHDVEEAFNRMLDGLNERLLKVREAAGNVPGASGTRLKKALAEIKLRDL